MLQWPTFLDNHFSHGRLNFFSILHNTHLPPFELELFYLGTMSLLLGHQVSIQWVHSTELKTPAFHKGIKQNKIKITELSEFNITQSLGFLAVFDNSSIQKHNPDLGIFRTEFLKGKEGHLDFRHMNLFGGWNSIFEASCYWLCYKYKEIYLISSPNLKGQYDRKVVVSGGQLWHLEKSGIHHAKGIDYIWWHDST